MKQPKSLIRKKRLSGLFGEKSSNSVKYYHPMVKRDVYEDSLANGSMFLYDAE